MRLFRRAAVFLCIPLRSDRRIAACPVVYAKNGRSADAAPPDLFNGRTQIPDSVEMFLFISFQGLPYFILLSFADTRCRTAMLLPSAMLRSKAEFLLSLRVCAQYGQPVGDVPVRE